MNWLSRKNKFLRINVEILNKLKVQKNSLWILLYLNIKSKHSKEKTVLNADFIADLKISKSSFYWSVKELKKLKLVELKDNHLKLTKKIFDRKQEFIKIHKKEIFELIGKVSANELKVLYLTSLLLNQKNVLVENICTMHNRLDDLCCSIRKKIKALKFAYKRKLWYFTFEYFKRWNLLSYQISRIFKKAKIVNALKKFFDIEITGWWRTSIRGVVTTYHWIEQKCFY